ncbi:hypothetical protein [Agaribacterium sp. ZY112]|uniref:hypothetical protein n=1 Tax=Agaribacterium sp. ZY112 TaxID=3233574 RepID=UPI0035264012
MELALTKALSHKYEDLDTLLKKSVSPKTTLLASFLTISITLILHMFLWPSNLDSKISIQGIEISIPVTMQSRTTQQGAIVYFPNSSDRMELSVYQVNEALAKEQLLASISTSQQTNIAGFWGFVAQGNDTLNNRAWINDKQQHTWMLFSGKHIVQVSIYSHYGPITKQRINEAIRILKSMNLKAQ